MPLSRIRLAGTLSDCSQMLLLKFCHFSCHFLLVLTLKFWSLLACLRSSSCAQWRQFKRVNSTQMTSPLGGDPGYLMQAGLTPTVPNDQQLMELQIAAAEKLYLKKSLRNTAKYLLVTFLRSAKSWFRGLGSKWLEVTAQKKVNKKWNLPIFACIYSEQICLQRL